MNKEVCDCQYWGAAPDPAKGEGSQSFQTYGFGISIYRNFANCHGLSSGLLGRQGGNPLGSPNGGAAGEARRKGSAVGWVPVR